jgi:hypothetical protein
MLVLIVLVVVTKQTIIYISLILWPAIFWSLFTTRIYLDSAVTNVHLGCVNINNKS